LVVLEMVSLVVLATECSVVLAVSLEPDLINSLRPTLELPTSRVYWAVMSSTAY
jgi:hypothetical protein